MGVLSVTNVSVDSISSQDALNDIIQRIDLVRGDFRQVATIRSWNNALTSDTQLTTAKLTLEVSGGTYIRSLAHKIGQDLGCGALLLNLKRTHVGPFSEHDSLRLTS